MEELIPLKVKEIIQETEDTRTFVLEVPEDKLKDYQFKPGQFIDIQLELDNTDSKRSYSISSSDIDERLSITVKKVNEHGVSHQLNTKVHQGDTLYASLPNGRFVAKALFNQRRNHFFIAAGSGITPIYAMIKFLLEAEPKSNIYLLYGNRTKDQIIFEKALRDLREKYAGQLDIQHVYSQEKAPKWKLFQAGQDYWTGRIDEKKLKKWLKKHQERSFESHYYVCGPGDLNNKVSNYLQAQSVPKKFIHQESFGDTALSIATGKHTAVKATVFGQDFDITMDKGETILEALINEGIDAPHSCTSGACSSCIAKLSEGSVEMEVDHALSESEKQEGYILTCQARPTSDALVIDYDD